MVELNVVAVDAKGQPVTDLTRDELRITDSNKPQTITFFHHRDDALSSPTALGPDEVSNRGRENVPRATMILFDLLNEDSAHAAPRPTGWCMISNPWNRRTTFISIA